MTEATRRINRGRGHRYLLDGEEVDGVTRIIGDGVPKQLDNWAARTAAGYAVDHWDELCEVGLAERLHRIQNAHHADRNRAGEQGTAVHELARRLAAGEQVPVPDHLATYVDAYLAFVQDWAPHEVLVEAVVLNRRYRYMGTLDLVAELLDTKMWLLDFKTSRSGVWESMALQLAAYRYAEAYLDPDDGEQPMPAVHAAGVVWLQPGGYQLVPVEAGLDTFTAFLHAQQVAHVRRAGRDAYVGAPLDPPVVTW